jgi:hypothetical protein
LWRTSHCNANQKSSFATVWRKHVLGGEVRRFAMEASLMDTPPLPGDRVLVPLADRTLPAVVQYVSNRGKEIWVKVEIEMDGPDLTAMNMYLIEEIQPFAAA